MLWREGQAEQLGALSFSGSGRIAVGTVGTDWRNVTRRVRIMPKTPRLP